jgi:hypothetical protein
MTMGSSVHHMSGESECIFLGSRDCSWLVMFEREVHRSQWCACLFDVAELVVLP